MYVSVCLGGGGGAVGGRGVGGGGGILCVFGGRGAVGEGSGWRRGEVPKDRIFWEK